MVFSSRSSRGAAREGRLRALTMQDCPEDGPWMFDKDLVIMSDFGRANDEIDFTCILI